MEQYAWKCSTCGHIYLSSEIEEKDIVKSKCVECKQPLIKCIRSCIIENVDNAQ